jgi:hypothetical protein
MLAGKNDPPDAGREKSPDARGDDFLHPRL